MLYSSIDCLSFLLWLSFRASRCHGNLLHAAHKMASSLPTRLSTGRLVAVGTKRQLNPITSGTFSQVKLHIYTHTYGKSAVLFFCCEYSWKHGLLFGGWFCSFSFILHQLTVLSLCVCVCARGERECIQTATSYYFNLRCAWYEWSWSSFSLFSTDDYLHLFACTRFHSLVAGIYVCIESDLPPEGPPVSNNRSFVVWE